jgi:drug/metabolite transporter superfamily protein YnfA
MQHATAAEGVTTAIVAFIFVCIIYPHLVKNRPQFWAALAFVVLVILIQSLATIIDAPGFSRFAAAFEGLLQVGAILLLVLSAGGLTVTELAGDLGRSFDVIRRGGEKETVIVPLSGEQPKPRTRDAGQGGAAPDRPAARPQRRAEGDSSIPLD